MPTKPFNTALDLSCVDAAIAHFGSKAALARAMNTSAQNVHNWTIRGTIPTNLALSVERESGGKIKSRDILLENESLEFGKAE